MPLLSNAQCVSRPSTSNVNTLVYCNLCQFLLKLGLISPWISLRDRLNLNGILSY
jgi:hypothetical protein